MDTNEVIKSKENNSWGDLFIVWGVLPLAGIGFCSIGYYIISIALEPEYVDIAAFFLGVFFALMGLLCIVILFLGSEELELDSEKLVVKSIFGYSKKVIFLKDIIRYTEFEEESEESENFVLTVYTASKKCSLTTGMSNYEQFKAILIQNAKNDSEAEKILRKDPQINITRYANLIGGSLIMIMGLGIYYMTATNWISKPILEEQITAIGGTLVEDIKVDSDGDGNTSIKILLQEYPKFNFSVASVSATSSRIERDLKKGDNITLGILNDDYFKKITKTETLEFWDKHSNYKFIKVYKIQANNKGYLTLDNLNKVYKEDAKYNWMGYLMGLGFVIWGISGLIKYKNQYNQI